MAIFVDHNTKVIVQGLTGGQGKYHGLRNKAYGTQVVAGVTPGKGGQDVEGIPVYDTVAQAVQATGATASFVTVPPKAAPAAILRLLPRVSHLLCVLQKVFRPRMRHAPTTRWFATTPMFDYSDQIAPALSAPENAISESLLEKLLSYQLPRDQMLESFRDPER